MTNNQSGSSLTIRNVKETIRKTRYRSKVTETDFYRPLSQLYDEVEENASKKKLRTFGWAFTSTGASHMIASVITEIPDTSFASGSQIQKYYLMIAAIILIVGLILVALSIIFPRNRSRTKEEILKKYICQEFDDDPLSESAYIKSSAHLADDGFKIP